MNLATKNQICSSCGHGLTDDASFCEECGTEVGSLHCESCGYELDETNVYCDNCGKKVNANKPTGHHNHYNILNPRMSLVFLLDTSSASEPYIKNLETNLNDFMRHIFHDPVSASMLDISIVLFSGRTYAMQEHVSLRSLSNIKLVAGGEALFGSPITEGVRIAFDDSSMHSNKPWIILISSSIPSDDLKQISSMMQSMQGADKLRLIAVSTSNENKTVLKQLTNVVVKNDGADFACFFDWIRSSIAVIASLKPDEKPKLPTLKGNAYRM